MTDPYEDLLRRQRELGRDWLSGGCGSPSGRTAGAVDEPKAPISTVERYARIIYETEPHEEGGEYVDGFQVSPGGVLTWEQAKARDAEFGDDPRMGKITEFAYKAATAIATEEQGEAQRSTPHD